MQDEVAFARVVYVDGTRDQFYRTFRDRDGNLITGVAPFQRRLASINSERTTGYSRVDVRGTYTTGKHWEFYGEVINLFNHRNYLETISEPTGTGERREIGRSNIASTFERMVSFGMRVSF